MNIKKVRKQEMVTKFYDQPRSQNPTYCFFFSVFKSELSVFSWSKPALTTIKENNSNYLCTDHLEAVSISCNVEYLARNYM